jgi:hypothetical protein
MTESSFFFSTEHNDSLSRLGQTTHTSLPLSAAIGYRIGLYSGSKLEGEWYPSRPRCDQVERTGYCGLRIVFPVSACSLVNGRTPADECNTVFGGEIRVCRNYHRRALRQRPRLLPFSKIQRRKIKRLPLDIASRTLRPFCKFHTTPTQLLPNSSAPSSRAPVHPTAPKYLSPPDLTMIWM